MSYHVLLAIVTDAYSPFRAPGVAPTVARLDRDGHRRNLEFRQKSSRGGQAHGRSDDEYQFVYVSEHVCACYTILLTM